jgi:hypothetical protein
MRMGPGDVVVGRYRIERELGRGGMGAVYLVLDQEDGDKPIALKLTAAAGHAHEAVKARFEREARIGSALGIRTGFVRALDWGELGDGRTLYMTMELVRGAKPLDLRAGTLDERLARLEAAAALVDKAHSVGVIHRDLKPANVLVDEQGTPWLADFGLAKVVGEGAVDEDELMTGLTQTGTGMGTPQFMPPEQFEDAKSVDARADVYALGVMLYQALTGQYPFDGRSAAEVLTKQLKAKRGEALAPRPRAVDPSVSIGLDGLCAEATALEREKRTSSAAIFLAALKKARGNLGRKSTRLPQDGGGATAIAPPSRPPAPAPAPVAPPAPAASAPREVEGHPYDPKTLGRRSVHLLGRVGAVAVSLSLVTCSVGMLQFMIMIGPGRPARTPPAAGETPAERAQRLAREAEGIDRVTVRGRPLPGERGETPKVRGRAEGGDAAAMLELSKRLDAGHEVDMDRQAALSWLRRATYAEHVPALLVLAQRHLTGDGVTKDDREAERYLQQAADKGSSVAEQQLEAVRQQREAEAATKRSDQEAEWQRQREEREERLRQQREEAAERARARKR